MSLMRLPRLNGEVRNLVDGSEPVPHRLPIHPCDAHDSGVRSGSDAPDMQIGDPMLSCMPLMGSAQQMPRTAARRLVGDVVHAECDQDAAGNVG